MSNVIAFPGATYILGTTFTAEALRAGTAAAENIGICRVKVDALIAYDRLSATYMLGLSGSPLEYERRCGALGLRRLLGSMEREAG